VDFLTPFLQISFNFVPDAPTNARRGKCNLQGKIHDNMKLNNLIITAILLCLTFNVYAQRERINFDDGWMFAFGNASDPAKDYGCGTEYFNYLTKSNSIHNEGPYAVKFKPGSEWKSVELPHDWVVDLPFGSEASYSHGHKQVGWKYPETSVGWYRKTFRLPEADKGKHFRLQFDGIFRDARIWVNGVFIGGEQSGYIHQDYDITDYLLFGDGPDKENLVCVRCDASLEEGWFYEGAGIYRHVWLEKTSPLHVTTGGTFVHCTLSDNYTKAHVTIETEVCNDGNKALPAYSVEHRLIGPDGEVAAAAKVSGKALLAREKHTSAVFCDLENPALWDTENPNLYTVVTEVRLDGEAVDKYITRTGFREIRLDKDKGFFLNGKHLKLKGFNCHQDHAGVGTSIPDGLQRFRIERLKWMGANAYRASHNPMTAELLDVCDELGVLVFEENRLLGINPCHLSVMENMIRRDRNHPSVFLWGIANEEWGLEWDDRSVDIAATMREYAHRADSTRPMGVASSSGPHILRSVDVAGYNYIRQHPIDKHRADYPERIALGSEETSGCGTRGEYFPDAGPGRMMSHNFNETLKDSIGFAMERGWKFYDERPWLLGLFYWTGFDYRGEPVPMSYPATGSLFGVLDYCGFAKDEAYYLKSWWDDEPVLHIFPHWNLEGHEGETVKIRVFSNCDEVQLTVNGRKYGKKSMPENGHLEWEAVYRPGYVQAVGYKDGKILMKKRIETAGAPARIMAEALKYDDIYVVNVSVADGKGRFVPDASLPMTVNISGNARILGYGNGDSAFRETERPADPAARSFDFKTFNGLAQILIKSSDDDFKFTIEGDGLQSCHSGDHVLQQKKQ